MMVLRHVGPPSATIVSHEDISQEDDRPPIPIDLSNKHMHSGSPVMPRHLSRRSPFLSITPSTIRPLSSPRTPPNQLINYNNNNVSSKCNSPHSSNSEENSPRGESRRIRKSDLGEVRWRDINIVQSRNEDDINSHSSPDSGLHRDSPGEDEDVSSSKPTTPPSSLATVRKQPQTLIPLSIIRARYNHNSRVVEEQLLNDEDSSSPLKTGRPPDQVLTKRARLEEMVTHIKSSKDRSRRNSGDDDTSSGGHVTSSDEIAEDGPTDLRNASSFRQCLTKGNGTCLNLKTNDLNEDDMEEDEEPCNLVCPKIRSRNNRAEDMHFDNWKNNSKASPKPNSSFSPTEAAKMFGVDIDTYQQQMMQFQLQSAAMLGDPGGILKAMGPYPPPLAYLGYYSQLLHSFQAQEILRQYAMQSNPLTPNVSQGDKSPSVPRTLGSSGYNCQSPLSPASLSEGPAGVDSDGSLVGQSTSGSANNGKRAPRAMTGRHVRTGTGASPSTLQTLRQKIEERQRIKAQQARNDLLHQPNSKIKSNKYLKKPFNKK